MVFGPMMLSISSEAAKYPRSRRRLWSAPAVLGPIMPSGPERFRNFCSAVTVLLDPHRLKLTAVRAG